MQGQTKSQQSDDSNKSTDFKKLSIKSSKQDRSDSKSKGFGIQKQSKNKQGSKQKNTNYYYTVAGFVSKPKFQSQKYLMMRESKSKGSKNRKERNQTSKSKSKNQNKSKLITDEDLKRSDQISYCSRATSPENYMKKFREINNKKCLNKKHLSPKYSLEFVQTANHFFPKNDAANIIKNAKSKKKQVEKLIAIPTSPKNKRDSLWQQTSHSNPQDLILKDKQYSICLNTLMRISQMSLKQIQSQIRIQNAQISGYFVEQESIIINGMDSDIITDLEILA